MPTVCIIKSRKYPLEEKDIIDGGTLNTHIIVSELRRRGYDIEVFTRNEGYEQEVVDQPGICVFRVPFARSPMQNVLIRDYEEGKSFVEGVISHGSFKPEKYACIHTHHWTSGVGLAPHIPKQTLLIHTPHLLAAEKARHNGLAFTSCVQTAEQALLNRANFIITLSKSEEAAVREKYSCSNSKVVVAPNGIDARFFEVPLLKEPVNQLLPILFIGRLCRQKGIDVLLDSVEQIMKSDIPVFARLVGDFYGEPEFDKLLEMRIHKAPLAKAVEHISEVTHDSIPALMSESFVYVQPSRYESQGVALLEAMAAGRVVVASNLPAIREYVKHGENGFLVDPENPQALADILRTILVNPKQALPLTRAARDAARKYSWQHMLLAVMPLFER